MRRNARRIVVAGREQVVERKVREVTKTPSIQELALIALGFLLPALGAADLVMTRALRGATLIVPFKATQGARPLTVAATFDNR
jgi:hypothetical protein